VDPHIYCARCDYCRDHLANHCANWQGIGIIRCGGFAEYTTGPARTAYKARAEISDAQLAFVEPLACVICALRRIQVNPADRILIFGCGPMGLLLLQALPAIRWLETNAIDVELLVSHRLSLSDFDFGFRSFLAGDTLKVHLTLGD